jgi:hypothetical protein
MSQRASKTAYSLFVFYAIMQKQFFSRSSYFLKNPDNREPPSRGWLILLDKKRCYWENLRTVNLPYGITSYSELTGTEHGASAEKRSFAVAVSASDQGCLH